MASVADEQLLELLLTLKKTTPQAARDILNAQPAISYALIKLMVSMNMVNVEVFQKTLAEYGTVGGPPLDGSSSSLAPAMPQAAPAPISALPPHVHAQYRGITPPTHTPTPPYGYGAPPPAPPQAHSGSSNGQGHGHPSHAPGYGGYGAGYGYGAGQGSSAAQAPPLAPSAPPAVADPFANISPEYKAIIMKAVSMTPEQLNMLPPGDRQKYIQIRASLGIHN